MKTNPDKIAFLQAENLIASELIYDGAILQLYRNKIQNEDNKEVYRELVHHQPAVAILAIDSDQRVLLVKQYRAALDREIYEIPAGLLDPVGDVYEEPIIGAKRELEEETGFQASSWRSLGNYYLSPGYLDEHLYFFLAEDLVKIPNPLSADEDEFISLAAFTRQEILNLIDQGEIIDLKTMFALNYYLAKEF